MILFAERERERGREMRVSKFSPVFLPVLTLVTAVVLCRLYAVSCDGLDSIENRLSLPLLIQKLRSAVADDPQTLTRLIVPGESFDGAPGVRSGGDVGAAAPALRGGAGSSVEEGIDGVIVRKNDNLVRDLGFVSQRKRNPEFISRIVSIDSIFRRGFLNLFHAL